MPWKETSVMDQRTKFVSAYLNEGDTRNMTQLCLAYGISRRIGYETMNRYALGGFEALAERSRAPHSHPNQTEKWIEDLIVELRLRHPKWGPKKLLKILSNTRTDIPLEKWPAISTGGDILKRRGLITARKKRKKTPPYTQPFSQAKDPNDLWCTDHKGWFLTGDGYRCEPLTITDAASRFILEIKAGSSTSIKEAMPVFKKTFREYGLPAAIRSDNGSPFASVAIGGLSSLSAWWIKLGIIPERIKLGCPGENGQHERMHKDLKAETASPPKCSMRAQQTAFDRFRGEYNDLRPHESLDMQTPCSVYTESHREYPSKLPKIVYPSHFEVRKIKRNGEFKWRGIFVYATQALTGEHIGLERISNHELIVRFSFYPLGILDEKTNKIIRSYKRKKETTDGPQ